MNKGQMNLQDIFLNQVRKERIPVTVYLIGGVQLKGLVKGFDPFTLMLDSQGKPTQLVYKHAIASVVPSRQVSTAVPEPEEVAQEKPSVEKDVSAEKPEDAQDAGN